MNCPQCRNQMIETRATAYGEPYHYCRACKKELSEMQVKVTRIHDERIVELPPGLSIDFKKLVEEVKFTGHVTGAANPPVKYAGTPYGLHTDLVLNGSRVLLKDADTGSMTCLSLLSGDVLTFENARIKIDKDGLYDVEVTDGSLVVFSPTKLQSSPRK